MSAEKDREPALSQASIPAGAVFLSYASQDAQAAQRICEALRAAGIEVWFDRSELRGGDAWDHKIRQQIRDCALFIPVISANTASRHEGYFRLEWDLADQRTHRIARNTAFIVPVSLDATPSASVDIPESFQRVQWTRLPGGETPAAFVERVRGLLSPAASSARAAVTPVFTSAGRPSGESVASTWRSKVGLWVTGAVLAVALASIAVDRFLSYRRSAPPATLAAPATQAAAPAPATAASFSPPPHSIAVLPFINMSGDKEQEYFSDGLSEELLNDLARINELQVAARTSAFSFKGKDTDIGTIARKLNVGAVLEGSVRRSAHTVRVTAQLINAVNGFHMWSQTYDRGLGDVLKLQTEIATAVAEALKVTLLADVAAKIDLGGTRNLAAFDASLRAVMAGRRGGKKGCEDAIAGFTEAIRLDPGFAGALVGRSLNYSDCAGTYATGVAIREYFDKAQRDAHQALALAPAFAQAHMALASYYENVLDFARASEAYDRARTLAPGNAHVLRNSGMFAVAMGHIEPGLTAVHRAVALDPLNPLSHGALEGTLYYSRRYQEAVAAAAEVISLNADFQLAYAVRGLAYHGLGDLERALASCEAKPDDQVSQLCLAVTYEKLGRHADAEAQRAKIKTAYGDDAAYQYAAIYAQWGNVPKALEWLDTAMQLRAEGLENLKTDPLLDPLRKEPRFQAIERALKFPSN